MGKNFCQLEKLVYQYWVSQRKKRKIQIPNIRKIDGTVDFFLFDKNPVKESMVVPLRRLCQYHWVVDAYGSKELHWVRLSVVLIIVHF